MYQAIFKYLPIIFSLLSIASAYAVEKEQLSSPRYNDHGVHYGLPGWETSVSTLNSAGSLPEGEDFLYIDLSLGKEIHYGGSSYRTLTIVHDGRIFLGKLPQGYQIPDVGLGTVPYVVPAQKSLSLPDGKNGIEVRWLESTEDYTVVEVGPFRIEGFNHDLSYQVFFYTDGEIQFQFWVNDFYAYKMFYGIAPNSPLSNVYRQELCKPSMYNGGYLVESDYKSMTNTKSEYLFKDGNLRPGWIAKSFDNKQVSITADENGMNVFFGTENAAGGLIAYDHSREHPIVGSFAYISLGVSSLSYGDGKTASTAIPVFLWYFGTKNGDIISKAHEANYPFYKADDNLEMQYAIKKPFHSIYNSSEYNSSELFSKYQDHVVIWPVAYTPSWDKVSKPDQTLALAFKFQTWDKAENRAIRFNNIAVGVLQPRSVQFLPPLTHTLTFETDGLGYMNGVNFSGGLPHEFIDNASIEAKIVPAPGEEIEEILVNGEAFYKDDGSATALIKNSDGTVSINWKTVSTDVAVKVMFKKCENRNLNVVVPSYEKVEVFIDPSDKTRKLESYAVKDGLGRVVQTQTALGNGFYKVKATYLDDFGSIEYAPMAYLSKKQAYNYEDMYCKQCVIKSSLYHNGTDELERQNAFGFPYAKEDYHYGEDYGVTKEVAGAGEASFAKWTQTAKQWTIPLKDGESPNFRTIEELTEDNLTQIYRGIKNKIVKEDKEYNYSLVINRSAEGVFTQQILDGAHNIKYSWARVDGKVIISRNTYNADNQLEKVDVSTNGGTFGMATTYTYDESGRVKTVTSPDKGMVETVYDSEDNIRFTQDARQRALAQKKGFGKNYFSAIVYDEYSRVSRTGEVRGGHSFDKPEDTISDEHLYISTKSIYGKPVLAELVAVNITSDATMLKSILDEMEGVLPNDVGVVIAYDGNAVASDTQSLKPTSMKLSSYNRLGKKTKQWTIYGLEGVPATLISFTYKASGELDKTVTKEWKSGSWNALSSIQYAYDKMGRVSTITEGGALLAKYDRADGGTVSKVSLYDKGSLVYGRSYTSDIYGRTTSIGYENALGKKLYSEKVTYPSVVAGRLATAEHLWDGFSSIESYSYDEMGRLVGYASDNARIGSGAYSYDGLGRIVSKKEGDTTITYAYGTESFRPVSMNVANSGAFAYYSYDASGNVWLDRNTDNVYKLNALGLPEKVSLYSSITNNVTQDVVDNDIQLSEEIGNTRMAYDESGNRIWTYFTVGAPYYNVEVTYPGVGEYSYSGRYPSTDYALSRLDLIGGGYRVGVGGAAYFPVKDVQGSVRGYADKTGLKSVFGYRPYGSTVDFVINSSDEEERWQSKEFDGEYGKYYFGARFFDPFFGLWMSPDPAGQYANPYTYGGDPLNYIDPTGMWSLGLGLVVGWDSNHGWNMGVGGSAEFFDIGYNASYSWNSDGSNSLNLGANASIPVLNTGLWLNLGGGYNWNSYTGSTLSTSGGVCYGASKEVACAGVETGGSLYWDRSGSFMGATVYAEAYVSVAGGAGRISSGYEQGLFGMEGRGLYAGGNVGGVYAQVAQNGGWSYGFQEQMYLAYGNNTSKEGADGKTGSIVSAELWLPTLGKYGHFAFGETHDVSPEGVRKAQEEWLKEQGLNVEYTEKGLKRLEMDMRGNGYVPVVTEKNTFFNQHDGDKITYHKDGLIWGNYGNVEVIENADGSGYSSYNYGNHWWTHLMIDYLGYRLRDY